MRFLVRLRATKVPRENLLEAIRTIGRTVGVEPRNPKWTSYGALELDIFSPTRNDFELFASVVLPIVDIEFTKDLNIAPPHKEEDALLAEARELFNAERYWEAHEVLEGIWRTKSGEEKRFLQGIILICAAFVHHQKGEPEVAMGVLRRAAKQLDYPSRTYGGLDVHNLRQHVDLILGSRKFSNFRT